eukprot:TRINITY_DN1467_c0_g1_i2.p1 TRINITY_DN1467_c0_g1~~TRINITY_DN1467_c0_g1_i2.p1  ORF type:complete len:285 (-),score=50.56 TRINITY_DN1467_c0_g1_i2:280-1134(-)
MLTPSAAGKAEALKDTNFFRFIESPEDKDRFSQFIVPTSHGSGGRSSGAAAALNVALVDEEGTRLPCELYHTNLQDIHGSDHLIGIRRGLDNPLETESSVNALASTACSSALPKNGEATSNVQAHPYNATASEEFFDIVVEFDAASRGLTMLSCSPVFINDAPVRDKRSVLDLLPQDLITLFDEWVEREVGGAISEETDGPSSSAFRAEPFPIFLPPRSSREFIVEEAVIEVSPLAQRGSTGLPVVLRLRGRTQEEDHLADEITPDDSISHYGVRARTPFAMRR